MATAALPHEAHASILKRIAVRSGCSFFLMMRSFHDELSEVQSTESDVHACIIFSSTKSCDHAAILCQPSPGDSQFHSQSSDRTMNHCSHCLQLYCCVLSPGDAAIFHHCLFSFNPSRLQAQSTMTPRARNHAKETRLNVLQCGSRPSLSVGYKQD